MTEDDLPSQPAVAHVARLRLAYRAEPRLLVISFVLDHGRRGCPTRSPRCGSRSLDRPVSTDDRLAIWSPAAFGLAAAAAAGWLLRTIGARIEMRFRDRATIEIEAHVAHLQASVAGIEHHERPSTSTGCSAPRAGVPAQPHLHVAVLDHRVDRPAAHHARPARVDSPVLACSACSPSRPWSCPRGAPQSSAGRGARRADELRLARHLFELGTTAPAGQGAARRGHRRATRATSGASAWESWYEPSRARPQR